jgi:hypothetical protein
MGVSGQPHALAALLPRKIPCNHYTGGREAPGQVWTGAENLAPQPAFDPRTVQPIDSRNTDYAIPALTIRYAEVKLILQFFRK